MNFIRVMHDRIYINCRRRVLIYLTAPLCAAVFPASPSAALTRSEDGFYLIATAAELAEFRDMVNEGNDDISAKLTADIDLSVDGEPVEIPEDTLKESRIQTVDAKLTGFSFDFSLGDRFSPESEVLLFVETLE